MTSSPSSSGPDRALRAPRARPALGARLRDLRFVDVVMLTALPITLALWVIAASVRDEIASSQYDDGQGNNRSVRRFAWNRLHTLSRLPQALFLDRELSAEDEFTPALSLVLDRAEWERVTHDPAASWGQLVDARLVEGNRLRDVKIKLRGDTSVHWTTEKKTIEVRTPKDDLYKGLRTLVFSVKDVLPAYVANSLAPDFGLLGPETDVVPVFLDQRFYGIARLNVPVDEGFLRRKSRMPGNVYRGDTAERGDYFKNLPRELFMVPQIWDRVARNDRPGAPGQQVLATWLADLNGAALADHRRFMARLDRGELARLFALMLLVGDPYHMSGVHNQLWYEDPTDGKLHPIAWDLRLRDIEQPWPGSQLNRFWGSALRDPHLLHEALRVVWEWIEDDRFVDLVRERAEDAWERHETAFRFDAGRSQIPAVGDPESVRSIAEHNAETMRRRMTSGGGVRWSIAPVSDALRVLDVEVDAWVGVTLQLDASHGPRYDSNLDGVLTAADAPFPEGGLLLLPAARREGLPGTEPLAYRMFLAAGGDAPPEPEFRHPFTGAPVETQRVEARGVLVESDSFHPWALEQVVENPPKHVSLAGVVALREDLVLRPCDSLTIEPGAELVVEPDVSILCKGPLRALGTAERPIRIRNARPGLPWGTLALQGSAASGSRLAHVNFEGGGGATLGDVEYKGMVSVHKADSVVFDSCEFSRNLRCDDALNVVLADVDLEDCWFHDVNADAIDYDLSTGTIRGCRIEDSGNDAIDLMTASPRIESCVLRDSRDKGVSIGEASNPVILDTRIEGCATGLEVKDTSRPLVLFSTVEGCKVGVLARHKNWRYPRAGWPLLVQSRVAGNRRDLVLADGARIGLADAVVGGVDDHLAEVFVAYGQEAAEQRDAAAWLAGIAGVAATDEGWRPSDAYRVLEEGRFPDDFRPHTWVGDGAAKAPVKLGDDLVLRVRHETGRAGTPVDWDLADATLEYALLIETRTSGVRELHALVARADGAADGSVTTARLALARSPDVSRWTAVSLAPGRYVGFALEIDPEAVGGRVDLRGWRVVARTRGDHR